MFDNDMPALIAMMGSALRADSNPDCVYSRTDTSAVRILFRLGPDVMKSIQARFFKDEIELKLSEKDFDDEELSKFISDFEFSLEQKYLHNVKIKNEKDGLNHLYRFYL